MAVFSDHRHFGAVIDGRRLWTVRCGLRPRGRRHALRTAFTNGVAAGSRGTQRNHHWSWPRDIATGITGLSSARGLCGPSRSRGDAEGVDCRWPCGDRRRRSQPFILVVRGDFRHGSTIAIRLKHFGPGRSSRSIERRDAGQSTGLDCGGSGRRDRPVGHCPQRAGWPSRLSYSVWLGPHPGARCLVAPASGQRAAVDQQRRGHGEPTGPSSLGI